jgi:hypothetical protein
MLLCIQGLHTASLRFAFESRSQRSSSGRKDASVRAGAAYGAGPPARITAVAIPSL